MGRGLGWTKSVFVAWQNAPYEDLNDEAFKSLHGRLHKDGVEIIGNTSLECFNPINFELDYHGDGYDGAMCFHYLKGKWSVSLYNDNSKVDVSAIAKSYKGGGHRGAAGFVIDDINEILKTGK